MKNKGFTVLEGLVVLAIIAILASIAISLFKDVNWKVHQEKPIIMGIFNGQEVRVTGHNISRIIDLSNDTVKKYADTWCDAHSISADQKPAKVKELTDGFKQAVSSFTLVLPPAVKTGPEPVAVGN